MTNDPIQHLRELMAKATPGPWESHSHFSEAGVAVALIGDATIRAVKATKHGRDWDDAHCIVAAINALPALLAAVEAARIVLKNNQGPCDLAVHIRDMLALQHALAKLGEVKP